MMPEKFVDHYQDWDLVHLLINKTSIHGCCEHIRRQAWKDCELQAKAAEKAQAPLCQIEWDMAMRKEWLEPQIRDAVLMILGKGYTTYYSGFHGGDGWQTLSLVALRPPPEEVLQQLWGLTNETDILTFTYGPSLDSSRCEGSLSADYAGGQPVYLWNINFWETSGNMDRLKQHWDLIAARLPSSGEQTMVLDTQYAKEFRSTHVLA